MFLRVCCFLFGGGLLLSEIKQYKSSSNIKAFLIDRAACYIGFVLCFSAAYYSILSILSHSVDPIGITLTLITYSIAAKLILGPVLKAVKNQDVGTVYKKLLERIYLLLPLITFLLAAFLSRAT